ncbi:enoyl-CoA hydratase-related protein [Azospirillum sp. TSH7]|uniref:enoyl-CoA hydratase-related protein n=2 Tax=unclassified Azospirillum TaxID=2630922 RepID=UPI001FFFDAB1|nr:enoyl-CoA hydratase-related protein [Azospirillum sp. TSH7]
MIRPFLRIEREGGLVLLTMDEPATRNALSRPEQCDDFIAAIEAINADNRVHVAILTGAGPAFCAGGNVKDMQSHQGLMAGGPIDIGERYRRTLQRLALALYGLEVPVIAAVNGPAMGAGLDLACMCDLRIASPSATFAETFVRLGLVSGIGGAWFLPRAIGQVRAAELAFTGRIIDAGTALDYGLVSEIVPANGLMDRARALADEIARNSAPALRYTKRLLRMSERSDLAGCLDATAALQTLAHLSPEHALSVDRYLEEQAARRAARRQLPA